MVDAYCILRCGLFIDSVCGCAFLQKGESVKKMREEVGSPEEIFKGILSLIPVTVAHVRYIVALWLIWFVLFVSLVRPCRVELALTSQRGTVRRGSSPWLVPPPPSLKPSP